MKIQESAENYLETILILQRRNGAVRSIDVAQKLGYSKPSVSRAMSILRADGYIQMEKSGAITLTQEGEQVARTMYERHHLLTRWLTSLGVPAEIAANDACRMEHALSAETFACIKKHVGE